MGAAWYQGSQTLQLRRPFPLDRRSCSQQRLLPSYASQVLCEKLLAPEERERERFCQERQRNMSRRSHSVTCRMGRNGSLPDFRE